jgi:Rod binding domain-containing protein
MKPNEVDISDSKASDELQSKETTLKVDSQEKDIEQEKLREAFHNFVGQTFFSQMLSSLRSTQAGAAYFNGGQTEKIFQGQLDQVLSEELTKSSADQIADPMFELFQLQRSQ